MACFQSPGLDIILTGSHQVQLSSAHAQMIEPQAFLELAKLQSPELYQICIVACQLYLLLTL